jgi:selenide,water dikinase
MTGPASDDATDHDAAPLEGVVQFVPVATTEPAIDAIDEIVSPRQIVLIGAGHTHLQIVKWWGRRPIPHAQLTLVSAFGRVAYSAMLPGALAGLYSVDEMLIDLPPLCRRSGVQLLVDRVVRLDASARRIELAHQPALTFDVASVNVGSTTNAELLCQMHRILVSIKPLSNFVERFEMRLQELLKQHAEAGRTDLIPVAVVGGGAAGVELALCLEERAHTLQLPLDVCLIEGGGEILAQHSEGTVRRARKLLRQRGIDVHIGRRIAGCEEAGPAALVFDDGVKLPCELAIWATGAAPPATLGGFDLPKSSRGFLSVRSTLQSTADVPVFAAGDAADIFGDPVPKAGVYAVRQAPVLWQNLRRYLAGQPLRSYHPQRGYLSLMACGDGTAILDYRGWSVRSHWAWLLKMWIDRGFVRQFR